MFDHNSYLKDRRDRWKAAGLCVSCGREKERDDVTQCNACKEKARAWRFQREYRITPKEFDSMLARQGRKCAICRAPLEDRGRGTHVDHDHETGKARAILCMLCNVWLGRYEQFKSLGLIDRFEEYLGRFLEAPQTAGA